MQLLPDNGLENDVFVVMCVDSARIVCSRVYVTVQCLSVCLSHLSTAAAT